MSMKNPRLQSILCSDQLQSAWGGMAKREFSHWHEGSDEGKIPQGRQLHQHIFPIYILNSASIPQGLVTNRTSINTLNSSNLCTNASLMKTPPLSDSNHVQRQLHLEIQNLRLINLRRNRAPFNSIAK